MSKNDEANEAKGMIKGTKALRAHAIKTVAVNFDVFKHLHPTNLEKAHELAVQTALQTQDSFVDEIFTDTSASGITSTLSDVGAAYTPTNPPVSSTTSPKARKKATFIE
ncbi:hypothetical protein ACP3TY_06075 [Pseudomonas rustica]|uniref:hypothetical protein n=1 Tax=Pseudomonas TaxID=286 RepID=UPI0008796565|nr:hypothetical protein [Pseudomonas sp. Z003-0.4C(8344-21)]SDS63058.1 hypothetical protein SAMN05216496_2031 [Pseudomonas sp. Z003-0.4C(8344-21)]